MGDKISEYIDGLTANGDISFTLEAFSEKVGVGKSAAWSAIKRCKEQNKIVSPCRGYYLILTPEFRKKGGLPADWFIDDLMNHLESGYYVCLLSAAMFYGAAHQQPQMMQVMLAETRKNIKCGNVSVQFIKNTNYKNTPVNKIKTRTGYMNVSTPEATARDLLKYMGQSGGMNRIATVIEELAESIDGVALERLAKEDEGAIWVRRLGYLLDRSNDTDLSALLYPYFDKKSTMGLLVPYAQMRGCPRNKKWRIYINTTVESDLDDTN